MENIRAIDNLDEMTIIIKNELENIAEGFVTVGFYLKKTMQDELYKQKGYETLYDYAKDVFGIGRTTAVRFMEINEKYSMNGCSPQIEDKWKGYGSSKLTEMLGLPEEIREAVPESATVKEIREAKGIIKETEKHYDNQMELCDIAQEPEESDWMQLIVLHIFKDQKEAFEKMVDWERKDIGQGEREIEEEILGIINPTKFKMIRLDRANVLLREKGIRVMPYRDQGEQQEFTYIDFAKTFEEIFYPNYPDISEPIQRLYETVYRIPFREEKKEEPKREESKKEPAKITQPKKQEKIEQKQEEQGESEHKNDEQIPGQTEITKDFPEYCPKEKPMYHTRKEYLEKLDLEGAAEYLYEEMPFNSKEFWLKWLEEEVDKEGREIEYVREE